MLEAYFAQNIGYKKNVYEIKVQMYSIEHHKLLIKRAEKCSFIES